MNIDQAEADHEAAQSAMSNLRYAVALYAPIRAGGTKRPIATAYDIEVIRTAQLAVIAAAVRCHQARNLSCGAIEAERTRLRAMDTETYRAYLL